MVRLIRGHCSALAPLRLHGRTGRAVADRGDSSFVNPRSHWIRPSEAALVCSPPGPPEQRGYPQRHRSGWSLSPSPCAALAARARRPSIGSLPTASNAHADGERPAQRPSREVATFKPVRSSVLATAGAPTPVPRSPVLVSDGNKKHLLIPSRYPKPLKARFIEIDGRIEFRPS